LPRAKRASDSQPAENQLSIEETGFLEKDLPAIRRTYRDRNVLRAEPVAAERSWRNVVATRRSWVRGHALARGSRL